MRRPFDDDKYALPSPGGTGAPREGNGGLSPGSGTECLEGDGGITGDEVGLITDRDIIII